MEQRLVCPVCHGTCATAICRNAYYQTIIYSANSWQPRNTILFLTDMRAQWSSFYRCTIAIVTSRTIITEDPVGPEADALRKYAQNAGLHSTDLLENITTSIPDGNQHRQ